MTPLDLGRDLYSSGLGAERSADPSTAIELWASGSDNRESPAVDEVSDSELKEWVDSVHHQAGSAGAEVISGISD